ncbi:hypothetical protein ADUPG1_000783, partial [Aduncisulcus paluster]
AMIRAQEEKKEKEKKEKEKKEERKLDQGRSSWELQSQDIIDQSGAIIITPQTSINSEDHSSSEEDESKKSDDESWSLNDDHAYGDAEVDKRKSKKKSGSSLHESELQGRVSPVLLSPIQEETRPRRASLIDMVVLPSIDGDEESSEVSSSLEHIPNNKSREHKHKHVKHHHSSARNKSERKKKEKREKRDGGEKKEKKLES